MRSDFLFPLVDLGVPVSDEMLEHLSDFLPKNVVDSYIEKSIADIRGDNLWKYARENFSNEDDSPWEMSPGELAIFKMIVFRQHPRCQIITPTQYGKSLTVSRALLTRVTTFADEWLLLVPDTKRGRIIIRYMIHDTAQNEYFTQKLFGLKTDDNLLMRLMEEKSKAKLTYKITENEQLKGYGSVEILTTDARRKQNAITSIMGFGGRNIVADEAALTDDEIDSGVFRMMAGKGEDTFLLKIGNPFFRNHFLTTWKDKNYLKVFINDVIGLCEGRYLQSFLDEASTKPNSDILYKCKFPKAGSVDREGWMQLMTEDEVRMAMQPGVHFGEHRMGVDVADEGVNESVMVDRSVGYAEVPFAESGVAPMAFVGHVMNTGKEKNINRFYVDRVGVGAGTYDRMQEVNRTDHDSKLVIFGVNAGTEPIDKARFFNRRAELYWRVREWIKQGGRLSTDPRWYQLAQVKYRANSGGKLQIMPKEVMRTQGIASPDIADALSLTFYDPSSIPQISDEDKFFLKKMQQNEHQARRGARPSGSIGRPR